MRNDVKVVILIPLTASLFSPLLTASSFVPPCLSCTCHSLSLSLSLSLIHHDFFFSCPFTPSSCCLSQRLLSLPHSFLSLILHFCFCSAPLHSTRSSTLNTTTTFIIHLLPASLHPTLTLPSFNPSLHALRQTFTQAWRTLAPPPLAPPLPSVIHA